MTVNLCFQQAAAVAGSSQRQSGPARAYSNTSPLTVCHWLGLALVFLLHVAGLLWIPESRPEPVTTPPKAIMVNWISAPAAEAPAPAPTVQPQLQPKPKRLPVKPKPEAVKAKQKTLPPTVKPQPVIATNTAAPAPLSVPASVPPASAAPTPHTAAATPAASSAANSSADTEQAPLTLPHLDADYLDNPAPAYPALSRQLGEQGKVLVRVRVDAGGNVEQITLRKTSGYERLDSAALETVKQWRFLPAQRAGRPVAAWVVVPISFSLEG